MKATRSVINTQMEKMDIKRERVSIKEESSENIKNHETMFESEQQNIIDDKCQ